MTQMDHSAIARLTVLSPRSMSTTTPRTTTRPIKAALLPWERLPATVRR